MMSHLKLRLEQVLLAMLLLGTAKVCAQTLPYAPARDVVREDELQRRVTAVRTLKEHLEINGKSVKPGTAPVAKSSLWTKSIILTDGEKFTLIPIGSILHLPAGLRSHVVAKPVGEFTFWPNFLRRNSAWLAPHEVSLEMARGDSRQAKAVLASIARDHRLLVAVYKEGPVTVLEPAPEESIKLSKP